MKNLLLVFLIVTSCGTKKKNMDNTNRLLQVDFQNFFERDVATFYINDCLVFENVILETDKIDGVTNMVLELKKDDKDFLVTDNYILNDCQIYNDNLSLKLILNNVISIFEVDLEKGKYVGFDKGLNNKAQLNQSKEPFEYD